MGFLATSKARSARALASASTPAFRRRISTRSGCSYESSWNAVAGRRSSLSKRSSPDPGGARSGNGDIYAIQADANLGLYDSDGLIRVAQ